MLYSSACSHYVRCWSLDVKLVKPSGQWLAHDTFSFTLRCFRRPLDSCNLLAVIRLLILTHNTPVRGANLVATYGSLCRAWKKTKTMLAKMRDLIARRRAQFPSLTPSLNRKRYFRQKKCIPYIYISTILIHVAYIKQWLIKDASDPASPNTQKCHFIRRNASQFQY